MKDKVCSTCRYSELRHQEHRDVLMCVWLTHPVACTEMGNTCSRWALRTGKESLCKHSPDTSGPALTA